MRPFLAVILVLVPAGCFDPQLDQGAFSCGGGEACPADHECKPAGPDGKQICVEKGSGPDGPAPDLGVADQSPSDFAPPDTQKWCPNGKIDPGEECEGAKLNGQTCVTKKWTGGTLACNAACRFDYKGCYLVAPDPAHTLASPTYGIVQAAELAPGPAAQVLSVYPTGKSHVGNKDIAARLLGVSTAGLISPGLKIDVTSAVNDQGMPAAAFDGKSKYLVVWSDARADKTDYELYGLLLGIDGAVTPGMTGGIKLMTATGNQSNVAVVRIATGWLVVWEDARAITTSGIDIRGTVFDDKLDPVKNKTDFVISGAAGNQVGVRLAAANNRVQVVWTDTRAKLSTSFDIYGRQLDHKGTLLGS